MASVDKPSSPAMNQEKTEAMQRRCKVLSVATLLLGRSNLGKLYIIVIDSINLITFNDTDRKQEKRRKDANETMKNETIPHKCRVDETRREEKWHDRKTRQVKTRQDKTRPDQTRPDRTRQDTTR